MSLLQKIAKRTSVREKGNEMKKEKQNGESNGWLKLKMGGEETEYGRFFFKWWLQFLERKIARITRG